MLPSLIQPTLNPPPQDLSLLTDRLSKVNESLARKVHARNDYDKTIQETEAAYMKVPLTLPASLSNSSEIITRLSLLPKTFL